MQCTSLPEWGKQLLRTVPYATLATVDAAGRPWNTPLAVAFAPDMTMYWVSNSLSCHSRNIRRQPLVFAVIYDSTVPEGEGRGLYLRMYAEELHKKHDIRVAKQIYSTAFFPHAQTHQQFQAPCPQRLYRARLLDAWTNEGREIQGHYTDYRVNLTLS